MREAERALRIVRPPDLVARAFELTGLDEVLDLRDDREHALAGR
jgi:anti-anti-sigma regulatory factor